MGAVSRNSRYCRIASGGQPRKSCEPELGDEWVELVENERFGRALSNKKKIIGLSKFSESEIEEFLHSSMNLLRLATTDEKGDPAINSVDYYYEDGKLCLFTGATSRKAIWTSIEDLEERSRAF
jgi:hypothetical protein